MAWPMTRHVGVGFIVFAVFRGSGLGSALPEGVGVYFFAVFRLRELGMVWPLTHRGRGSSVRCVS